MTRLRAERGSQAVELALVALVVLLVSTALVPIAQLAVTQSRLSRAAADGLRYATRVLPNPCTPGAAGCPFTEPAACGAPLRRRPTASEVSAFVREAAGEGQALAVSVTPAPCAAVSGQEIRLELVRSHDLGPLAEAANRLGALVSGRDLFPAAVELRTSLLGYEE